MFNVSIIPNSYFYTNEHFLLNGLQFKGEIPNMEKIVQDWKHRRAILPWAWPAYGEGRVRADPYPALWQALLICNLICKIYCEVSITLFNYPLRGRWDLCASTWNYKQKESLMRVASRDRTRSLKPWLTIWDAFLQHCRIRIGEKRKKATFYILQCVLPKTKKNKKTYFRVTKDLPCITLIFNFKYAFF